MTLTPFHLKSIWDNYHALRPRKKETYKDALSAAIAQCKKPDKQNLRILVLGAGDGSYDVGLLPSDSTAQITVVDWNMAPGVPGTWEHKKEDIEEFLANDANAGQFDIVVAFLILQHLVNWRLALANIAKVAPGGILVFDEYETGNAGWFDWIDCTSGFIGLDYQEPQTSTVGKWAAFFRDYYIYIDRKYGLFWEPEVRGTDYTRLHQALRYANFVAVASHEGTTTKNLQTLANNFTNIAYDNTRDPARLYSHFAWGSKTGEKASNLIDFIHSIPDDKSYKSIKNLISNDDTTRKDAVNEFNNDLTFKNIVSTYRIPNLNVNASLVVAARLAETYWFEGFHDSLFHRLLLLHIKELSATQADTQAYGRLQRQKLIQYLIMSGGLTHSLVFSAPVLMTIKNIDDWQTITSSASLAIVNSALQKKLLFDDHMSRMITFAKTQGQGSLTESLLNLRLPISILFRQDDSCPSQNGCAPVSIALHDMHTGKLAEIAIPKLILDASTDASGEDAKNAWLSQDPKWRFSRFRAGTYETAGSDPHNILQHPSISSSFLWLDNERNVSEHARSRIQDWVLKVLPYLAPLLKQNVRVVVVGLYHVRVDDGGYGGLGSLFLAEDIPGKLTRFDLERLRFIQAESEKFSSIYLFESLKEVFHQKDILAKEKEKAEISRRKFDEIKQPLEDLSDLRVQMEKVSNAINAIETTLNPFHLNIADPEIREFAKDVGASLIKLEPGGGNFHNISAWDETRYQKLCNVWEAHKNKIQVELQKTGDERLYENYFAIFDQIVVKDGIPTSTAIKAAHHAKALYHKCSPACWVYTSLSYQHPDNGIYQEVVLGEEVPPLVFNLALIQIGGKHTKYELSTEAEELQLEILIKDKGTNTLSKLKDAIETGVSLNSPVLISHRQKSSSLSLLIKASQENRIVLSKDQKQIVISLKYALSSIL